MDNAKALDVLLFVGLPVVLLLALIGQTCIEWSRTDDDDVAGD